MSIMTSPTPRVKTTDKITTDLEIYLSNFYDTPLIPKGIVNILKEDFKSLINTDFFKLHHMDFLNNYFQSQFDDTRRPSVFLLYQLTKTITQTWYNNTSLESYTNIVHRALDGTIFGNGKTYTKLELDEPHTQCKLFTKALLHITMECVKNTKPLYDPILNVLGDPNEWIYFNTEHYDINMYYVIKHKNKTYYISYVLIGVFVNIHEFKDPTLKIRSKTTILDPILRLLLTVSSEFYEEFNRFNMKLGQYYIEVTEYEPQIMYKYMGKQSNLTYQFYKSKIIEYFEPRTTPIELDIPSVKIPKQIKINMNHSVSHRRTRLDLTHDQPTTVKFEKDRYTVRMGFHTTTIILLHIIKKRPTIPFIIKLDSYDLFELEPPIIIPPQLKPLNIIFKHGIKNIELIRKMINETYIQSHSFREHMNQYKNIKIIKDLHTDMSKLDKSKHFNCVFLTDDYESSVYHLYIDPNNKIVSITTIINII